MRQRQLGNDEGEDNDNGDDDEDDEDDASPTGVLHPLPCHTRAPSQYKDRLIYVWQSPC